MTAAWMNDLCWTSSEFSWTANTPPYFTTARLELVLTVFEENHRECLVYETLVESLICYLREKYQVSNSCRYLPIPEYFKILPSDREDGRCKMIISRNPVESQYKVADFTAEFQVFNRSL